MATIAEPVPAPRSEPARLTGELQVRRLVIAHVWVAIAAFAVACLLGVWQMWARSPIEAPAHTAANYFRSVTMHGVSMAFVLTTFFIMGYGYFVAETALKRPMPGLKLAWGAFFLGVIGVLMAALAIISGNASVLYTFYPPLTATAWFYIGLVLVVVASWVWCLLMLIAMRAWKADNPGRPVPLAMFGPENYGYRLGLLGAPSRVAMAAAPLLFGMLIERYGVGALVCSSALSLAALVGLCTLRIGKS